MGGGVAKERRLLIKSLIPSPDPSNRFSTFEESIVEGGLKRHGVHAMIWSPLPDHLVLKRFKSRAAVLVVRQGTAEECDLYLMVLQMQLRFDGHFGFPGGLVDDKLDGLEAGLALETVTHALNRELVEEVNMDLDKVKATRADYCYTYLANDNLFCHFYAVQVTLEQFKELERGALGAEEMGQEVMGHVRVPLYNMENGDNGFQAFLRNNFIGPALTQLFVGLFVTKLFELDELRDADEKNVARTRERLPQKVPHILSKL